MSLKDKIIFVTGATSGIGEAIAIEAAELGAKVIVHGRDSVKTDEISSKVTGVLGSVVCDLSNTDNLELMVKEILDLSENLDGLVLNAGTSHLAEIDKVSENDFDQIMNLNFKSIYFTIQKLLPFMNVGSSIVINCSVMAHKGFPGMSVYSASKAAVKAMVKSLSLELASKKIRINIVSPGVIDTPIYEKLNLPQIVSNKLKEQFIAYTPMKRAGTSAEVANSFLYLLSDDASYITGAEINVDGGLSEI